MVRKQDWSVWVLLFLFIHDSFQRCSYQFPKFDEVEIGVPLLSEIKHPIRRKRSSYRNLRIQAYFDDSIHRLSEEQRLFINGTLLVEAAGFWEQALMVKRIDAPVRLNRKCITSQYYMHKSESRRSCAEGCKPTTTCGEVTVPDQHLLECRYCLSADPLSCTISGPEDGSGVQDADFLLYVSSVLSDRCRIKDTVAYAAHCQLESTMDRPIAGHVNLCPQSLSVKDRNKEVLISTVKHEILHALGFSSGLYAFYRDPDTGEPLTERSAFGKPKELNRELGYFEWSERTIRSVTRDSWWTRTGNVKHTVNMFVTPRVTAEVREHFGCQKLEGAELENQGGDGTALTHWEKRLFENEAMTGTHTQNPVYSRITLALMEDTGWYRANYSVAEQLQWGRHLGCDFSMNSCGSWIRKQKSKGRSASPFCDQVKKVSQKSTSTTTTCTAERDSVALCNLVKYNKPISKQYQNFGYIPYIGKSDVGYYGGSVEMADFCPYNQEFEWKNDTWTNEVRDSRCEFEGNTPPGRSNAALESYGGQSKCFLHDGPWKQKKCGYTRTFAHYGAGCYQYICFDGVLWLNLMNGTAIYPCYREGQLIPINRVIGGWLHTGNIVCPKCSLLCPKTFVCNAESDPPYPIGDPAMSEPCFSPRNYYPHIFLIPCIVLLHVFSYLVS